MFLLRIIVYLSVFFTLMQFRLNFNFTYMCNIHEFSTSFFCNLYQRAIIE